MARDKPGSMFSFRKTKNTSNRSTRDEEGESPETKETKPRKTPEGRESGRFPSAARLLRSLGRSRDDESPSKEEDSASKLSRKNPQYHSEGKGLRKKSSQNRDAISQRERSQGFCDKEASRKYSLKSQKSFHKENDRLETPSPSHHTPSSKISRPLPVEPLEEIQQNIYEVVSDGRTVGGREKTLTDAKSARKLTKDSGFEAAPYCESEYTNTDGKTEYKGQVKKSNPSPSEDRESFGRNEPLCERVSETCCTSDGPEPTSSLKRAESLGSKPSSARAPSVESLDSFGEACGISYPTGLVPASSTPTLSPSAFVPKQPEFHPLDIPARASLLSARSTPNLDGVENDRMVTKQFSMHPFVHNSSLPSHKTGVDEPARYYRHNKEEAFNQNEYAKHLRSSSFQMLHPRQASSGSYHSRQPSNTSNYSEDGTICLEDDRTYLGDQNGDIGHLGDSGPAMHQERWRDPNMSLISQSDQGYHSQMPSKSDDYSFHSSYHHDKSYRNSSPPPPPVRDASSLKYIRYGPGHEKFPSWPVPAGSACQVLPPAHTTAEANISGLPDALGLPHGCHRSHSWTEQSEYPKDTTGEYTRPHHKNQFNPGVHKQLMNVMDKCEKISPDVFRSRNPEELLQSPNYSILGDFAPQNFIYFPPYDREGKPINDKDYNIPSPPERDSGMNEASLNKMTIAQLEEHARLYDVDAVDYSDYHQVTPLLDQLRQETYIWDDGSERDSGRGESESVGDSCRFSGRDSVATVVTNSSSASSSETLKWHGSLSDVSIMSGGSRFDQNVAHSSRVQTPKRQSSESIMYYTKDGRRKIVHHKKGDPRLRDRLSKDILHTRSAKELRWNQEIERINEMNCLKKFPSYSYSKALSQITEAPAIEASETNLLLNSRPQNSPSIDMSQPPSVADRISSLEQQNKPEVPPKNPRHLDTSEHQNVTSPEDLPKNPDLPARPRPELRKNASDQNLRRINPDKTRKSSVDSCLSPSSNGLSSRSFRGTSGNSQSFSDAPDSTGSSSPKSSESERTLTSSTSYIYLDPEKKCMVSDSTLKSIQKQALLSFYERKMGKSTNSSPRTSESDYSSDNRKWSQSVVTETNKCEKGMARIARVPEMDDVRVPCTPIRRPSVNSREVLSEPRDEDGFAIESVPPTLPERPPQIEKRPVPAVPQDLQNSEELNSPLRENGKQMPKQPLDSPYHGIPYQDQMPPSLPPISDDTPPRPPDRPPKKPNLRSIFRSQARPSDSAEVSAKRIEASANELRNLSPARPYYYRKPPAPDPPASPLEEVPLEDNIPKNISRGTTPEPPLPPPPIVVEDEVLNDEPLPPPPLEMVPEMDSTLQELEDTDEIERAYHKDSYMAHRKDWKSGFEGRYRRTHSPSAPLQRVPQPTTPNDHISTMNFKNSQEPRHQNIHNNNVAPRVSHPSLSTSNIMQTTNEYLDNERTINNNDNQTANGHQPNDWPSPNHHTSTTVTFTNEELKAFKARKLLQESRYRRSNDRTLPPAPPFRDAAGSVQSLTSSSGSSNLSTPPTTHNRYGAPWRASLDSLHQPRTEVSQEVIMRPISRAVSMGEPLHKIHSTSVSSESLADSDTTSLSLSTTQNSHSENKTTNYAHSSPVSTHRLSTSSDSPILHDGPITAHPATVTEESSPPDSPVSVMEGPEVTSTPRISPLPHIPSPKSSFSLPKTSLSEHFSSNMTTTPSHSVTSLCSNPRQSSANVSPIHSPSVSFTSPTFNQKASTSTMSLLSASSMGNLTLLSTSSSLSSSKVNYGRALSVTGTSCTMAPAEVLDEEENDRTNIVTLDFGRAVSEEEKQCRHAIQEFLSSLRDDSLLKTALLRENTHKGTGDFMKGVFLLEFRKDLLCPSHSTHPDIRDTSSQSCDNSDLVSDSVLNKAKAFVGETKSRPNSRDDLIKMVTSTMKALLKEQQCIQDEVASNVELGEKVKTFVQEIAKSSEFDKYKTHVGEIDKIASLLLGLSARLAKAENSITESPANTSDADKKILESKRDKLAEQFEEAKKIKHSIDKRALQVSKLLMQYLTESQYAEYDHFIKMKAKLLMDSREISDKILLADQQLKALQTITL